MSNPSEFNLKTRKSRNDNLIIALFSILAILTIIGLSMAAFTGAFVITFDPKADFKCKEMGWTSGEYVNHEIYCHRTVWGTEYTQNYRVLVHCDRDDWQCQTEVWIKAK
jgi:hypothetical protein